MTNIMVSLSDERMQQLRELAARTGVAPEDLARAVLEDWLNQQRKAFAQALLYVLDRNAELYRRLS